MIEDTLCSFAIELFTQSPHSLIHSMLSKEQITIAYKQIQDEICTALEQVDGSSKFEEERWEREGGGGGRTRIIQNGSIF